MTSPVSLFRIVFPVIPCRATPRNLSGPRSFGVKNTCPVPFDNPDPAEVAHREMGLSAGWMGGAVSGLDPGAAGFYIW